MSDKFEKGYLINKVFPAEMKALPIVTALVAGAGMACNAQNQNNINNKSETITVNDSTKIVDEKEKAVDFDVAARTF